MHFILISIICSVFVGVLLKIARNKDLSIYQIISWNYLFALLALLVTYKPVINTNFGMETGIVTGSLIFLLPVIFVFQAKAIKHSGIVKTDIAQRLSLFISICFSLFIAKEIFNSYKVIGLIIAFIAIFFTFYKKQQTGTDDSKAYFLVLVLGGFGIIDILFKKVATIGELKFTELLLLVFIGALAVAWTISGYYITIKKEYFSIRNMYWGILVGLLNFSNISFYIKAHQNLSSNPSTVFIGMNMGVILLGSMIGVFYFKEKLTKLNYFGVVLSLLSIVLIAYSQMQ
ncbi:EamA family transporter [Flavobacterium amniphilum]|uniref:EamA family transporter n=1 Tax=Flavobacterium amniphilum TaxID=1834035 RepID=UPI00202A8EA1|nr:EamA family transporter [Flavobacterium amniphilum]MCL9805350.1 EamA family transporter [Flavobacterium amniphilum]